MSYPNFHIIGAPKCGTDTIAGWLRTHGEIDLSERRSSEPNLPGVPRKLVGKVSPWLLASENEVPAILERNPGARFIVCLRNPIDMAWVLHSTAVAEAREPIVDFSTAWEAGIARRRVGATEQALGPDGIDYASTCALGAQLIRLTAFVDPDQIHLVFLDDILSSPKGVWTDLQVFLEIEDEKRSSFPLEGFLLPEPRRGLALMQRQLAASWPAMPFVRKLVKLKKDRAVNGLGRGARSLREMPQDLRRKVCDHLSDDIGLISALSGRDLAHWLC